MKAFKKTGAGQGQRDLNYNLHLEGLTNSVVKDNVFPEQQAAPNLVK